MSRFVVLAVMITCLFIADVGSAVDGLDRGRAVIARTNSELQTSQEKIDRMDAESVQMFEQYKGIKKEIENYLVYNRQLTDITTSQQEEIRILQNDINQIEATGQQIMPFMQKMIEGLERFIDSDLPFLPDERRTRIQGLSENMKRADLSIATKYRQILEAYQIEMDYGQTIEAYTGNLENKQVWFLKVGRIGFYYLALDMKHCGAWNPAARSWISLDDVDYTMAVAKAIKIADKQRAPDLFFAAVPPAEDRK
ncbi:MAG: DUF3450 domain-containing protein [Pseudomonadota bacterium]